MASTTISTSFMHDTRAGLYDTAAVVRLNTTLDDWPFRVDVERVWLVILFVPLIIVGLIGNALVCAAIYIERTLHNVTNYFLFSLAVADWLVCALVMPTAMLLELRDGEWWPQHAVGTCMAYVYADVFLCTASIVHMCVISLDRYLGISRPLEIRNRSIQIVIAKIAGVWLATVIISCPLLVLGVHNAHNVLIVTRQHRTCAIHNAYYKIYGSTLAFLIPLIIMIVSYLRTTSLLREQALALSKDSDRQGSSSGLARVDGLRRTIATRPLNNFNLNNNTKTPRLKASNASLYGTSTINHSTIREPGNSASNSLLNSDVARTGSSRFVKKTSFDCESTASSNGCARMRNNSELKDDVSFVYANTNDWRSSFRHFTRRTGRLIRSIASKARFAAGSKEAQEIANETKATRVLGIVFACFFICWTPFFAINFMSAFCAHCKPPDMLMSVCLWLGYVSSIINPLIYTIFNRRFRQTFHRLLMCRCTRLTARQALYSSQCAPPSMSAAAIGMPALATSNATTPQSRRMHYGYERPSLDLTVSRSPNAERRLSFGVRCSDLLPIDDTKRRISNITEVASTDAVEEVSPVPDGGTRMPKVSFSVDVPSTSQSGASSCELIDKDTGERAHRKNVHLFESNTAAVDATRTNGVVTMRESRSLNTALSEHTEGMRTSASHTGNMSESSPLVRNTDETHEQMQSKEQQTQSTVITTGRAALIVHESSI